eukprot:526150-Rhodomonas_salina.1
MRCPALAKRAGLDDRTPVDPSCSVNGPRADKTVQIFQDRDALKALAAIDSEAAFKLREGDVRGCQWHE